jgi:hypothetical protein
MANRPQHTVRTDELTWERFGDAAKVAGYDRSTLLRQFMRWYARERGATLPPRPSQDVEPLSLTGPTSGTGLSPVRPEALPAAAAG